MICVITDHLIDFPPTQTYSCFVLYLEILAIQHLFFFALKYYHLLCQECCEELHHLLIILDIVILLAISVHILVPVLFLTGIQPFNYDV